ncbi:hypothetical protein GCM10009785_34740 [Brooklawnia cerclae]
MIARRPDSADDLACGVPPGTAVHGTVSDDTVSAPTFLSLVVDMDESETLTDHEKFGMSIGLASRPVIASPR